MNNFYYITGKGAFYVYGNDRIDFFDRMTTNDFRNVPSGTYKQTVVTNDKGRIIDFISFFNLTDKSVVLSTKENKLKLINYLNKFIINDDVQLQDLHDDYLLLAVYSDEPKKLLNKLYEADFSVNNFFQRLNYFLIYPDNKNPLRINIVVKSDYLNEIREKLNGYRELSEYEYELFRIDNFLIESTNELNEEINPLECGLKDYISFTKGCYVGQEVISRIDSQNKLPKTLLKFKTDSAVDVNSIIYKDDGKDTESGFVTSLALDGEKYLGLCFIRTHLLDSNKFYVRELENKIYLTLINNN